MKIPEKITVRLDFTVKELLSKYLRLKLNTTASRVIRSALRRYLETELQEMAFGREMPQPEQRPAGEVAPTKARKEKV